MLKMHKFTVRRKHKTLDVFECIIQDDIDIPAKNKIEKKKQGSPYVNK